MGFFYFLFIDHEKARPPSRVFMSILSNFKQSYFKLQAKLFQTSSKVTSNFKAKLLLKLQSKVTSKPQLKPSRRDKIAEFPVKVSHIQNRMCIIES